MIYVKDIKKTVKNIYIFVNERNLLRTEVSGICWSTSSPNMDWCQRKISPSLSVVKPAILSM